MDQKDRDVIMREFRSGSSRVLITTDLLVGLNQTGEELMRGRVIGLGRRDGWKEVFVRGWKS